MLEYIDTGGYATTEPYVWLGIVCLFLLYMFIGTLWERLWWHAAGWGACLALAVFYPVAGMALGLLALCVAIVVINVFSRK